MTVEDLPVPTPRADEVLVRAEAVGVNFADVLRRRGDRYPEPSPTPFTLGDEVAGTIETLGEGVTDLSVGDLVYAASWTGD